MAAPSQGAGNDVNQELTEAVDHWKWTEVNRLIHSCDCSDQQRHWAITHTVRRAPARFVNDNIDSILDECASEQLQNVVTHLLRRRLWRCVGQVLQRDIGTTLHRWVVGETIKYCGDDHCLVHSLLPHCSNEELEHVLTYLVSRGLWGSVDVVLERDIGAVQHRWAVEEALKHARAWEITDNILHHCTEEEVEQVLIHMVSRGLWEHVDSGTHSDTSVTQQILSMLVSRRRWKAVGRFLQRDISSALHRWAVEQASRHANNHCLAECILPQCHDEELQQVIAHLVSRDMWGSVHKVLKRGISPRQHWEVVREALKHARAWEFTDYILPHCTREELELVLTHVMSRGLWNLADEVLGRDISAVLHSVVVVAALKHARAWEFTDYILHHCTEEELELVLTHMVSRGLWKPVDIVTNSDASITQQILSMIVSRRRWKAVSRFLQRDISSAERRWAIEQASRQDGDYHLAHYILPHCSDREVEYVISHVVSRGLWWLADRILKRGVSAWQRRCAVEEALKHAGERTFTHCMLHHCTEEQLEQVLTHMVSQGVWKPVDSVKQSGVSVAPSEVSAIQSDVSVTQSDVTVSQSNVSVIQSDVSTTQSDASVTQSDVSVRQSDASVTHSDVSATQSDVSVTRSGVSVTEQILSTIVSRRRWRAVGRFLQRDISSALHRWAVEQASRQADDDDFAHYILPQCHDEELEHVVAQLMSRGFWRLVGEVLERGISARKRRWAVEQASEHAGGADFDLHILPQCHDEELEPVLSHLLSRGLWWIVDKCLERGISAEQHRRVLEEALKLADERLFPHCILHHCTEEQLEQVLTHLVSQGVWKPVDSATQSDDSVTLSDVSVTQSDVTITQSEVSVTPSEVSAIQSDVSVTQSEVTVMQSDVSVTQGEVTVTQSEVSVTPGEVSAMQSDVSVTQSEVTVTQNDVSVTQSEVTVMQSDVSVTQSEVTVTQSEVSVTSGEVSAMQSDVSVTQSEVTVMQSHVSFTPSDVSVTQSDVSVTQSDVSVAQSEVTVTQSDVSVMQGDIIVTEQILSQTVTQGRWEVVGRFLQRNISSAQHRWAVEQASRHAGDDVFVRYVLPQCHDEELEHVIVHLVSRGLWGSVNKVLERGISTTQHSWVVAEAAKHASDASFVGYILRHCSEDDVVAVFPLLVANKKWQCTQHVLCDMARDTLYTWMASEYDSRAHDTLFWKFIHHCHVELSLAMSLTKAVTHIPHSSYRYVHRELSTASYFLGRHVFCHKALCESLITSLLHILCYVMCNNDREYTDSTDHTKQYVCDIYTHITVCIKDNTNSTEGNILKTIKNKKKWITVFTDIADSHKTDPLFLLHFLQGLNRYHVNRRGENDDTILLVMLAVFPLFPQLQSVALRMMLRDKRWDVIKKACLSHVWEHDRRRLFKAAVEQRQWSVVRQWSDHTVHDDQREWAMIEALKEEEWEVYLLLADHGLTMPEQMHAHYMVAKYGDWDTVLKMVERGGDITEVSNLLENWVTGNLRKKPQGDVTVYMARCEKLIRLRLRFAKNSVLSPMKALKRCKWGSVLFNILHEPTEHYFSQVLDKVIEEEEWHILMHLVRLGMNAAERNWLFPQMVRQQQWGVCRMLLEYGVDDQLCVDALPELMERNQWTLVARVMEYNVDDAVRRQVMQCAFQRRAGALFWHCLNVMENKQPLTKETRVKLFHQAISRDMWQAVKPLVEEKDGPGLQRRDMAFLEAIEQHLWDVVDYCQLHGADINMEDENGETPLHREARKREWKAVEEIVLRDGKPNLLDKDGISVLNRLIHHEQWDTVKIVLMYGGNIHLPARYNEYKDAKHTPLQALIDARQADIIQFSIMWCGDQKKGLNDRGETCFHAVCDSDSRWDVMEDLIVRKVDPLAVTKTGKSALAYAVLNTKCPERMVAECSKLGFSSHQPPVTGPQESLLDDIIHTLVKIWEEKMSKHSFNVQSDHLVCDTLRWHSVITSPLVCAVLRDCPVLVLMLHESASCSKTELVTLCAQLPKLTDVNIEEGKTLHEKLQLIIEDSRDTTGTSYALKLYSRLIHSLEKYTAFLRELLTTPRSLRSSCRLLIAHRFHFRDTKRHQCLDELPLPVPLKNYLEFSDFCDPDYGKHMGLPSAESETESDLSSEQTSTDGEWSSDSTI